MPTANGKNLTHAQVIMARVGNWNAELDIDHSAALTGSVALDIDGQAFAGHVVRSGVFAGNSQARIVGGKGGLGKELPAKSYVAPSFKQILSDLLRECGETVSSTADAAVLAKRFSKWHREKGAAIRALDTLVEIAGADWRMLADGTIWIGRDTYPEQKFTHQLISEDWARGVLTIDPDKPQLRPGVTFRGLKVEEVRHYLTPHGLRSEAAAESLAGHFRRLLADTNRRIDYSRRYPAKVSKQNPDKTLQVVLDDAIVKSPGLDKVPIRHGFPGTVTVPNGARVMIGFDAGDPSRPYAEGWEGNTATEIVLANGAQRLARQGDLVQSGGPGTVVTFLPLTPPPAGALPMLLGGSFLISFSPIPPTLTPPTASPLYGAVATGSPISKG